MIAFFTDYWELITQGTWISWIVTIGSLIVLAITIYFRRFFMFIAIFTLCSVGVWTIATNVDLTPIGTLVDFIHNHIKEIIKK